MSKEELIAAFYNNHECFLSFIQEMDTDHFMLHKPEKWTPGQQLEHIGLCIKPLEQVLANRDFIAQKFGTLTRPAYTDEEVVRMYTLALAQGGKAPDKFVPTAVDLSQKEALLRQTRETTQTICNCLRTYTEDELDTLVLPHPLLGSLSIREMFYLMSQHALHHLEQMKLNLRNT